MRLEPSHVQPDVTHDVLEDLPDDAPQEHGGHHHHHVALREFLHRRIATDERGGSRAKRILFGREPAELGVPRSQFTRRGTAPAAAGGGEQAEQQQAA